MDTTTINNLTDKNLERALLTCLFTDIYATDAFRELQGVVVDEDFTTDEHRQVWQIICKTYDQGKGLSPLNMYLTSCDMGITLNVAKYTDISNAIANVEGVGRMVHYLGQRRRLAEQVNRIFLELIAEPSELTNEQASAELERIAKDMTATSSNSIESFGDVYGRLLKVTQDKANGIVPQGVPSGFAIIDRKGGLERGELMIIAGRNSNGKTSLALCIALNASLYGEAVGIFSLEMTNLQLTTRLTSLMTGIDGESLKRGQMSSEQWSQFVAIDSSAPIYFDKQRSTDGDTLISNIKAMVAQKGVQIVVIDYLQLLRGKERERLQQIGGIAHKLEALSKQLGITIILLSQLRRNQPQDPSPKLEELKESGDIADAADSIYLVYRPERHGEDVKYPDMSKEWSKYPTKGTALIMCAKNRQGAMGGEQLVAFDATTTRFYEKDFEPSEGIDLSPRLDDVFN